MAHTPGPWKVINGTVYIGNAHDAYPDDRECIAKMAREPRHLIPPSERDENARLIAAAPELLAACEQILWKLSHNHADLGVSGEILNTGHPATIDRRDATVRMLEDAVNKAKGV